MHRRAACDNDFEQLFAMHREAVRDHVENLWGPWDDSWQRENFRKECESSACEVLIEGDSDIGFVQYVDQPGAVRVWNVALRPAFRGRGFGTRLFRELQRRALDRGVPLQLRVFPTNIRAYEFYLRLGFSETAREPRGIELAWEGGELRGL